MPRLLLSLPLLLSSPAWAQDSAPAPATVDLAVRVEQAIDRGVETLLQRQNRDGSWTPGAFSPERHWDHRNSVTAFALYTLLKCKVPRDHPAMQRGMTYLLTGYPNRTYSIGVQLMLLGALGDEEYHERMEEMVDDLMEIRGKSVVAWPYPEQSGGVHCLSNAQYAALGLRAAQQVGLDMPRKVWSEITEIALDHQVSEEKGDHGKMAGFRYDVNHPVTGSMTTAGLSMLAMAEEAEGGLDRRWKSKVERSREYADNWLKQHWTVEDNPQGPIAWHYYFLYGLERIGSIQGRTDIAGHDWYREGAEFLVRVQSADGSWSTPGAGGWPPMPMTPANTCFALLFLTKASRAAITGKEERADVFIAEAPSDRVWLRAFGQPTMTAYVSGFGDGVVEENEDPSGEVAGLRVVRAEYWVDGVAVRSFEGDPRKGWNGERFALRHTFEEDGAHTLEVRVIVLDAAGREVGLRSRTYEFESKTLMQPWMMSYAADAGRNLLLGTEFQATSSSDRGGRWDAKEALDGTHMSSWIAAQGDTEPTWSVDFDRPIRGNTLMIGQVDASPSAQGQHPRIVRARVRVNRNKPVEVVFPEDPMLKAEIDLGKRTSVRRIEVVLLQWTGGAPGNSPGLAEVELMEE